MSTPATETADVDVLTDADGVTDGPNHWIDADGQDHPTISKNVGRLLERGYAWDQLTADDWIGWNDSTKQWLVHTRNEDAMNALLAAWDVEHRVEYEDESILGQVPEVVDEVVEDVKTTVADVWDQTKMIGMVVLGLVGIYFIGRLK